MAGWLVVFLVSPLLLPAAPPLVASCLFPGSQNLQCHMPRPRRSPLQTPPLAAAARALWQPVCPAWSAFHLASARLSSRRPAPPRRLGPVPQHSRRAATARRHETALLAFALAVNCPRRIVGKAAQRMLPGTKTRPQSALRRRWGCKMSGANSRHMLFGPALPQPCRSRKHSRR